MANAPYNPTDHELARENRMLRGLLDTVRDDAAHNYEVMKRFQSRALALLNAKDLRDLLRQITAGMRRSFSLDTSRLLLVDPYAVVGDLLRATASQDDGVPRDIELCPNPVDAHARFSDTHSPWLGPWNDVTHAPVFGARLSGSVALLPLRQPDGVAGFLCLQSNDPQRFQAGYQTDYLANLARICAVCLENAVNRERLRLVGLTDSLTGLYNRRHLQHRLAQEMTRAQRYGQTLACLFIDADHFKQINDRFGHPAGDQVLVSLAQRLRRRLRASDIPTRYGGEEFAVLLPQTDAGSATQLAEQIRQEVASEAIPVEGQGEIAVTVSIGVAAFEGSSEPDADPSGERLLAAADEAVYRAKSAGRNQVWVAGDDAAAR
ncbi:MAG: sensor domain-containing diguanylate cyclase [Gammaproteobacteria bacterium]|nr:sensor domain-containing diguanylate cyclase [Gammaproteobacteria bacterium]